MDILSVLCNYLSERTGLLTATEIPKTTPKRFITVIRNGGARDYAALDRPTITVQAWAETEAAAYEVMQDVRSLMADLVKYAEIPSVYESSVRINNPLDGKHRRYEGIWFLICTI